MTIYGAIYSGVPVHEMLCRNVAVMKRRADNYLNATQILKVAGIEKGRRTKILEKEVMQGEHEKVQGGYGKYQGTWIPFERGLSLAKCYAVDELLKPLFDYVQDDDTQTPTKEQALSTSKTKYSKKRRATSNTDKLSSSTPRHRASRTNSLSNTPSHSNSLTPSPLLTSSSISPFLPSSKGEQQGRKRSLSESIPQTPEVTTNKSTKVARKEFTPPQDVNHSEKYRAALMAIFLNEDGTHDPDLLTCPDPPKDLDVDLVVDDQGHTSLHWAAALSRMNVLRLLITKGANIMRKNFNGETALIRAVMVTNCFDQQTFPVLLEMLSPCIWETDKKSRTILHHIALTAGAKGKSQASRYYMECILEYLARANQDLSHFLNIQDKSGDTALNISAKIGSKNLAGQLLEIGANPTITNKAGLGPEDFGVEVEDYHLSKILLASNPSGQIQSGNFETSSNVSGKGTGNFAVIASKRGKEVLAVVQSLIDEINQDYSEELATKQEQMNETQKKLKGATMELADVRKKSHLLRIQAQKLTDIQQRIKNLENCLREELQNSNTLDEMSSQAISKQINGSDISMNLSKVPQNISNLEEPTFSTDLSEGHLSEHLQRLRDQVNIYMTSEHDLQQQLHELQSITRDRTNLCRKLVAACCRVPVEEVDGLLDPLLEAVESDGEELDISKVATLMANLRGRGIPCTE